MSEKSVTRDGVRYFTCKRCGNRNAEGLKQWRKKQQKSKNICLLCLEKEKSARLDARERGGYGPYFGQWGF